MTKAQISVLLADDHPAVRAGVRQFIERDPGITVLSEVDDGAAAIAAIHLLQPDVAVVDLRMPRLSGLELITQIRGEGLPTACIVLTAYDGDPYVFAALRAGAKGYLLKTAGPEELAHAIRMVHAGHFALTPEVTGRVMDRLGTPAAPEIERLSERELEVLKLAGRGLTNRAIGTQLGISDRTIHSHLVNVFGKLGVSTRTEAVLKAMRMGWISLEDTAPPDC
ncbi:MAG: response regulator [Anaerolineae bacterium]